MTFRSLICSWFALAFVHNLHIDFDRLQTVLSIALVVFVSVVEVLGLSFTSLGFRPLLQLLSSSSIVCRRQLMTKFEVSRDVQ